VFAFADEVIGRPQTWLFAAFGSFAFLVLAEFGGRPKTRLLAYAGLGVVGALFVCVGTVCSRTPWLGAVAMAVFAFLTLFSGAFSGYLAAGSAGAILAFVLSVNVPARNSVIPDRLLGWVDPGTRLDHCGVTLHGELTAHHTWYVTLGHTIVNEQPAPPPHVRDVEGRRRLLACVRAEARTKEKPTLHAWVALVATLQHLENLRRLEMHVAERANATRPASPERGLLVRLGLAS